MMSMTRNTPDDKPEGAEHKDADQDALMMAADDLIKAVHAKDANAVSDALKAAFDICDSYEPEAIEIEEK